VSATGGTPPCTWSLAGGTDWFAIDSMTGPGTIKVPVTVTDAAGVTATRMFDLGVV
jgi:hypothetical protein